MKKMSVRKMHERIRMLEQANRALLQEKEIAKIQQEALRRLPTFDKEMMLRLLEVVYATKGGMASWGRR